MSSEAITRNDLTAVLNEVLPPTPSEFKKLLWTNPSPTATFSPQTVSLDLSEYDEVEIISKKTASEAFYFITNSTIGVVNDAFFIQGGVTFDRQITVSTTGIEFTTAYYLLPSSSAITTDNNRCVPYQIYGIKYERVAPPQVDASDYVIEQGTETVAGVNWIYRKWNSGIAECWGKNASSAGVAAGYNNFATRLPDMFIQAYEPICTFSGGVTGTASSWVGYQRSQWSTDHWYLDGYIANGGGATTGAWFYIHAIGKWK